jgi:cob(I)alamin adenosyltransferase
MDKGLVHIYCGNGKGKTTAAMGLCLRAAGNGLHVGIAQFLKSGDSGELNALSTFNKVKIYPFLPGVKFTFAMNEIEKNRAKAFYSQLLGQIRTGLESLDVLLLDEAIAAATEELIDINQLIGLIQARPKKLEVVLTGRVPQKELIVLADYISEIHCVRHPYDQGIRARKGIEW